jgi:hypothetical protein
MNIPPLAGLCTYEEAAHLGYSVEQNVQYMLRYAWIEKQMMELGLLWMNPTPEWEVKEAYSLHLWLDTEHAGTFRDRISEMRNPPPRMDVPPDERLDQLHNEVLTAETTLEKIVALYGVLKPALLAAYRQHLAESNPVIDYPTNRIIQFMAAEEEQMIAWGNQAIAALMESASESERAAVEVWKAHVEVYLQAAGGVRGEQEAPAQLPATRVVKPFEPDFMPQRDARFKQTWNFVFPPHEVASYATENVDVEERTLALMCKRTLEMDVPEAMASMIMRAKGEPWEYYRDMCRQLWDECRHAMMGSIYFENHGIPWREKLALHLAFPLHLNLALSQQESHVVLFTIEQGLMPAKTGKRYEWETARTASDPLATLFQDYDWADEVLHAQIGRRWLLPKLTTNVNETMEKGREYMSTFGVTIAKYQDRAEQHNWWPEFVRETLGRESAMKGFESVRRHTASA